MNRLLAVTAGALLFGTFADPGNAEAADPEQCWVVDVDFTPSDDLQIAVWLEDASGNYVDTLYLTELTGHRGLGNRPGRLDFNSGPKWPYGRRENTFPVWSHRHGLTWPKVYFQNDNGDHTAEDDLSHNFDQSSAEEFYCRPLRENEAAWDAETCASAIYTDKGVLSATENSLYPPREDLVPVDGTDDPSVSEYAELNPFDAVTQATPIGGHRRRVFWSVPDNLPAGDYVVWVEVAKEFDYNATYNPTSYPEPQGILYKEYGVPYRGQPSVVYQAPFEIGPEVSVGSSSAYAGYGDPDGQDGTVRPPDSTIDTAVPGSGALRLLTTVLGDELYRVRVESRIIAEDQPPGAPADGQVVALTSSEATVSFVEPPILPGAGAVQGYEIRYRASDPMTEGNFFESSPTMQIVEPRLPGAVQELTIPNLLPRTHYFVGIRAFDDCQNYGPLTVVELDTPERPVGEVDACFIATAAYGSLLANDVEMLRHVRDSYLRSNVLGELLVEAYYTFGPALAGLIGESEDLRGVARGVLDPIVDFVRGLSYDESAEQP
jgi:hypothetical protein